ncbi:prolyl oligopeptidase family serine peptidase [Niabella insulamsoli]|uniref:alpha/beta hydrolase n=1 Tax=Niabella insulamsoli TaxID=3144874 RepID=UPI0031FD116C
MKQSIILFLFAAFFSCSKDEAIERPEPPPSGLQAETLTNVAYDNDPLQKMDIYLPENRTVVQTKVLVLIHGGAWSSGDKADFTSFISEFKELLPDYAIFNINYRLSTGFSNNFPTQENDLKTAVDFIYDHRAKYVISDKWVLAGVSSGAHLALLQSYKNSAPVKPRAVIDFFGPVDMVALYQFYSSDPALAFGLRLLMTGTPFQKPDVYRNSSPIQFVNANTPPTIIFHGGVDDVVPKEQSFALRARLDQFNVPNELVFYANQTHGWSDPAILNDSFKKIEAFLKANVR